MRIANHTTLETADLRAIAARVAAEELDPDQRRGITIHFIWRKARTEAAEQARFLGYRARRIGACPRGLKYNQAIVRIRKARPDQATTALLLAHEFAELRGRTHAEMRSPRYRFLDGWTERYAWADALPLRERTKKEPLPTDRIAGKLAHSRKMIQSWETRLKRGTTALKKWRAKERYYLRAEAKVQA